MPAHHLAYGKTGLEFNLPAAADVTTILPAEVPGLSDPAAALERALAQPIGSAPLRRRLRPGDRVAIVLNDITRHTPSPLLLKALLTALDSVPPDRLRLFIATGTHRPNTDDELEAMLGPGIVGRFPIIQNDSRDRDSHLSVGVVGRDNQVLLHRQFLECEFKILTGFIEPHLFAGFSGGAKAVLPGLAHNDTILRNHSAANVGHPNARWGVTEGNPIWAEIRQAGDLVEPAFLLNVTLNQRRQVTGVFAGDLRAAHDQGCAFVKASAMVPVARPFDVVIGCNAGFPLDLNVYQSIKGMSAAAQIVRQGGAILVAAECWDGIPEGGEYARLLRQAKDYTELLRLVTAPGFLRQDAWQAQIQAVIGQRSRLYLHSHRLSRQQVESVKLRYSPSIEATVRDLLAEFGPSMSICVMPEGPMTVPYLTSA